MWNSFPPHLGEDPSRNKIRSPKIRTTDWSKGVIQTLGFYNPEKCAIRALRLPFYGNLAVGFFLHLLHAEGGSDRDPFRPAPVSGRNLHVCCIFKGYWFASRLIVMLERARISD